MSSPTHKTLGTVVSISKGKKHAVTDTPSANAKRLIGIDDLRNDDLIRYTDDASGTDAVAEDVLIAWDGANAGTIGFGKAGFIGSTIARLRTKEKGKFSTPFLGAFLQSKFAYLRQTATGATIPHINRKALEGIVLPEIGLDDQKRIAHLLGKVEGLIARRKKHLRQLDDLLKSVFLEMFGDPVRNEKGWDERELGKAIKIKHGFAFKSEFFNDEGPFVLLTPGNFFEEGGFRERGDRQKYYTGETPEEYILDRGALLLAMTEQAPGLLGSPLMVPDTDLYLHNQRLGLVVAKEPIQTRFLFHLFNQRSIRQIIHSKATGTKVRHTSPTKLESIVVGYPPIEFQNKFAAIVEKVESIKSRYQQSLTDLESLYGALSQKAFKGQLDLSRVPLPVAEVEQAVIEDFETKRQNDIEGTDQRPTLSELVALTYTVGRKALLDQLLPTWLDQLGDTPFSVQHFMEHARQRASDLIDAQNSEGRFIEHEDVQFGPVEYDHLKTRLSEALEHGRLTQGYDDANNRVQVITAKG